MDLERYEKTGFSYPQVGATRNGVLPAGYRHLRRRHDLGPGASFERAVEALMTWRVQRAAGLTVTASAPRAEPGAIVVSRAGVGRLALEIPCRVVWTLDEADRRGFAYGTLPGHPERGEESFVVERGDDGSVAFIVTSFTRPGRWYTRPAWPLAGLAARFVVARYAAAARRLAR
ncbi:DUF1990 domain-containing protein [Sphaerisporangium rufum]|uniref:DUF1990 domain-containing protein n=1 Tax=Sphaerisporangium rufum TaxID=1381558 RepID=A0A919R7D2_9ACTN|nr:DUF1990 domain-containing protein [Sphaerisporangium rufum]GII81036.1 DUF1990 domain-containing protein [Sphaerisporangium rufum]